MTSFATDIRLPSSKATVEQRSINLAISSRGLAALHCIDSGAAVRISQTAIPMRGRMIHDLQGKVERQMYDIDGQVCVFPQFLHARGGIGNSGMADSY